MLANLRVRLVSAFFFATFAVGKNCHTNVEKKTRFCCSQHPGGVDVLLEAGGRDASKDFDDVGHSDAAM